MAAWISIVSATMQVAKSHHQLAEDLSTNIINQLKAVAARKEEARKKVNVASCFLALVLITSCI